MDEALVPDAALEQALRHLRIGQLAVDYSRDALSTGGDALGCSLARAVHELSAAAAVLQEYVLTD